MPRVLQTDGVADAQRLRDEFDGGKRSFSSKDDFKKTIYGHDEVRQQLEQAQHSKCCYCEIRFLRRDRDVEHFRPKSGYQQRDGESLKRPGYYWLAYDWSNLLLACAFCNRRYKKNYFPLENPSRRAKNHRHSTEAEKPLIINPAIDDPLQFLVFEGASVKAIGNTPKGEETIKRLGLNDQELVNLRSEKLAEVKRLFQIIRIFDEMRPRSKATKMLAAKGWTLAELKADFESRFGDTAEFSAMLRAARDCNFEYD